MLEKGLGFAWVVEATGVAKDEVGKNKQGRRARVLVPSFERETMVVDSEAATVVRKTWESVDVGEDIRHIYH